MEAEERQKYIKQIGDFPNQLEEIVSGLSDKQLDTSYGEGKWTVRQVVHHLADSHIIGHARTKWALTEENPALKEYQCDIWAKLPDYSMPINNSLDILKGLHKRWYFLFENLSENEWTRPVDHPDPDYSNVEELLRAYARHGEKHLGHIRQVIK